MTRSELIDIITDAIRRENATGSDVKGLSATLRELVPDLFTDTNALKVPANVLIEYITSFAGRPGAEIVQELGGCDFVASKVGEVLRCRVTIEPE